MLTQFRILPKQSCNYGDKQSIKECAHAHPAARHGSPHHCCCCWGSTFRLQLASGLRGRRRDIRHQAKTEGKKEGREKERGAIVGHTVRGGKDKGREMRRGEKGNNRKTYFWVKILPSPQEEEKKTHKNTRIANYHCSRHKRALA